MNYLTNYYKNLSEQLQNKINVLQNFLTEVAGPPTAPPPTQFVTTPVLDYGANINQDWRRMTQPYDTNFPPIPWNMIVSKPLLDTLWALFWREFGYGQPSTMTAAEIEAAASRFKQLLQRHFRDLERIYTETGDPDTIWGEWLRLINGHAPQGGNEQEAPRRVPRNSD